MDPTTSSFCLGSVDPIPIFDVFSYTTESTMIVPVFAFWIYPAVIGADSATDIVNNKIIKHIAIVFILFSHDLCCKIFFISFGVGIE